MTHVLHDEELDTPRDLQTAQRVETVVDAREYLEAHDIPVQVVDADHLHPPTKGILGLADEVDADLIVLGGGMHGLLEALLTGDVARSVGRACTFRALYAATVALSPQQLSELGCWIRRGSQRPFGILLPFRGRLVILQEPFGAFPDEVWEPLGERQPYLRDPVGVDDGTGRFDLLGQFATHVCGVAHL